MAPREDDHENYEEGYVEDSYETSSDNDAYVDDVSDDGEWVEGEEGDASQEPPPKKKKSSALTTVIIVVVAVLGVLGFMVIKGGKAPSSDQAAPAEIAQTSEQAPADASMPADQAPQPAPIEQPMDSAPVQPAPQQGLMDNPELANQGALPVISQDAAAPQPADLSQDTKPENAGLAGAVTAAAPQVQAVSDFPTVDSIKKPEAGQTNAAPIASLTSPTETMAPVDVKSAVEMSPPLAAPDENKAQLDQANAKIAELQRALSDKDTEIQKQKESQQSSSKDAEINALKDKISELESKLSTQSTSSAPEIDAPREVKPAPVAKPVKTVAAKPKEAAVTTSKKNSWVLKSAKPGHAVIENTRNGDYRSISIGDDVPGVGKITAIGESPSGWTVQGTTGKISE